MTLGSWSTIAHRAHLDRRAKGPPLGGVLRSSRDRNIGAQALDPGPWAPNMSMDIDLKGVEIDVFGPSDPEIWRSNLEVRGRYRQIRPLDHQGWR